MELLEKIHGYMESLGLTEKEIKGYDGSSIGLAKEIAYYAHRNEWRENGENYAAHPFRCLQLYDDFVGITPDDPFCIDVDLMAEYNIPFDGVQEVCLLHDVFEDTEVTLEEVAELYDYFGLKTYFELYMRNPLTYITHVKSVPYGEYIKVVMNSPISAMAKMMDMVDNSNLLGRINLDEKKIEKTKKYIDYVKTIDDKFHFLENVSAYKVKFFNQRKEK